MGVCHPVLQILFLFQTKKCNFPQPFSHQTSKIHTCFQTSGLQAEIMWLSLLRLERKQNSSSNPFRIRIFLFLSYSLEMETINFSYIPIVPDSRPKWAQCIPVFRPKRCKNLTQRCGSYLYSLFKGAPPPPPVYVNKRGYRFGMKEVKFFCQHFVYKFIIQSLS